jgi:hypothetical protein
MAEDLIPVLTRFHRDILMPDMQRLVAGVEQRIEARFDDTNQHFDEI